MPRNPNQAARPSAPADSSSSSGADAAFRSSAESPVSPSALPVEAELRAADLETSDAAPDATLDPAEDERQVRVRAAAYAAWLRRGGQPGDEVQDWLDAEREVDAIEGGRASRD